MFFSVKEKEQAEAVVTIPQFPSLLKFTECFFVISRPKGDIFYDQNMNILRLKWAVRIISCRFRRVECCTVPFVNDRVHGHQSHTHSHFQTAELNIFKSNKSISGSHRKVPAMTLVCDTSSGLCMKYGKWRTEAFSAAPAQSPKWAFLSWVGAEEGNGTTCTIHRPARDFPSNHSTSSLPFPFI